MKIYAIIPARGGSKGVPGKNIKPLGGYPLLAYSIAAAAISKSIDRVIVSTDSEEIAEISKRYGAEIPFMRPTQFAGDRSSDRDFVVHAIDWFEKNEGKAPEYFIHLRPTTPLRDPKIMDEAVTLMKNSSKATSLRSAHPCSESPFKWFLKKDDGFYTGINTDDMDLLNQPRQLFPVVYIPDGYVDVLSTSFVKSQEKGIHGQFVLSFVSPVCREVDSLDDFEALEFQIKKHGSPLLDYLKKNFQPLN